jgi:hypothetical protein
MFSPQNGLTHIICNLEAVLPAVGEDVMTIVGWAVPQNGRVASLWATLDDGAKVLCHYGQPRPDVVNAYKFPSSAVDCGFTAAIPLQGRRGKVTLKLFATMEDGLRLQAGKRPVWVEDSEAIFLLPFPAENLVKFPEARPVFIVGMSRSGTTAMTLALQQGAGIPGYPEGHLFHVLREVVTSMMHTWELEMQELGAYRIPEIAIGNCEISPAVNDMIRAFHNVYRAKFGSEVWLDKTPGTKGVRAIPLLHRLYPNGRFIFMHRHPIKVILSALKKFPERPIVESCRRWALCMEYWRQVRSSIDPQSFVEVGQHDLSGNVDQTTRIIAQFLNLDRSQAEGVAHVLRTYRPESTGSSADAEEVYVEDLDWSESDKHAFLSMCSISATQWGYRITRNPLPTPGKNSTELRQAGHVGL